MALEAIKDQIRDQVIALWGRVQESSLYNSLMEQYQAWPTSVQRLVAFGSGFLVVLMVLSIPYSRIDSASVSVAEFTEYRTLLRDLLRIGRAAKEPPPLPPGFTALDLQTQIQNLTGELALVPEQLVGVLPLDERPAGSLAPPAVQQQGVSASFKKLNLSQVLDIGFRLQMISPGTKLTGLNLIANSEDNHYYDVTYKVVSFSLPQLASDEGEAPGRDAPRPGRGGR